MMCTHEIKIINNAINHIYLHFNFTVSPDFLTYPQGIRITPTRTLHN